MNRVSGVFALIAVAAAGFAAAQQPPNMPSQNPSAQPAQGQSNSQPRAMSQADENRAIKECIQQQRSNNSGKSVSELKQFCKQQVENPQSGSPQQ